MTRAKLWNLCLLIGGVLAVLAPDLTGIATWLAGLGIGWLSWVARVLGILALVGSRWDVIKAKLEPLLTASKAQQLTGVEVFEKVASRAITPDQGAAILIERGALPTSVAPAAESAPVVPIRKPDNGRVSLGLLRDTLILMALIGLVSTIFLCALSARAKADTPISKCWSSVCIGPQVAASTFTLRFDTKALVAQIPTGLACYGFNLPSGYLSGGWCVTGQLGTKATTQFIGTGLLFTVMRAVVVGPVYHYGDDGNWFGVALGGSLTSAFNLEAPAAAKAAP